MVTSRTYPRSRLIDDIEKGQVTVITTSEDHDFTDGEILSIRISPLNGMFELNQRSGRVLSHTDDTVTLEIDSTNFNDYVAFVGVGLAVPPQIIPSCSGIIPGEYTPSMNLEDAFDRRRFS